MAILIDKDGNKEEIPYYCLEQKFIQIIQNSSNEIKKQFEKFKQNYKYFNPYFDFVIFHLGYTIENPMGYEGSFLVSKDDKIYILENMNYKKYKSEQIQYSNYKYFTACDDETVKIEPISYNPKEFDNGMIDYENNFIHMGNMRFHINQAVLIVNQMLIRNKNIYEKFIQHDSICNKELDFLIDEMGFIRFGILDDVLLTYRKSKISDKQKAYIDYLEKNNFLMNNYIADKDEAEKLERESFKSGK